MMIKNKTKGTLITGNKKVLSSILSKAKGLMFSRKISDIGYVFVFDISRRIDLHMFFVFFPIDVLFLDKQKKVVETKESFMPFSIYISKNKVSYVIELPKGSIKKTKTKVGDLLEF